MLESLRRSTKSNMVLGNPSELRARFAATVRQTQMKLDNPYRDSALSRSTYVAYVILLVSYISPY